MGPSTLAAWALLIARALDARGIDAPAVFRRAGLSPERLRDANARYPAEGMQRLWRLSAELTGDPGFGLAVGQSWHPTTFHALGYVALASASLREALTYLARYSRIVTTGALVDLVDEGAQLELRLSDNVAAVQPAAPRTEIGVHAGLAAAVTLCTDARGSVVPLRCVTLRFDPSACAPQLEEFFNCPVRFKARHNAIVFDRGVLDEPIVTHNQELLRINHRLLTEALATLDAADISARVRVQISRLLPSGKVDQATVARALHLSRRSLQRRLNERDLSFRTLVDDTRRELAEHYISDASMSSAEIAYLLGFAETSSLSRAMRRWKRSAGLGGA
jgi:AraC-like DNA-binding protein